MTVKGCIYGGGLFTTVLVRWGGGEAGHGGSLVWGVGESAIQRSEYLCLSGPVSIYCCLLFIAFYLVGEFSIGAGLGPKSSTIRFSIIHSNTPI